MAAPTNHFKLGLFVLATIGAVVVAAVALGANSLRRETVAYHTYFNESVQGLDIGSAVKYRGVTIGKVAEIEIAPDRRHVDVTAELDVEKIDGLGLTHLGADGQRGVFIVPDDLRTQLGSQGITGVKFVSLDFFDPETNPAPDLEFSTPPNTIPAASSLMKTLEDSIVQAVDELPAVASSVRLSLERIDQILVDMQKQQLPEKVARALDESADALHDVRTILRRLDESQVPQKAAATIENLDVAITKLNLVLDQVGGDEGLVASAQRATDQFGELGQSATSTTGELDATLRDVGEAAQSIRALADTLERDPDMLLKGPGERRHP